jgi:signal transduction histidine kinase
MRARSTLAHLANDLRQAPRAGLLEDALARALGDPSLTVAFPLPGRDRLVGSDGRAVSGEQVGRARTAIARGGETIAIVMHDPRLLEAAELGDAIGAAARLAVDNERLRVEGLTQLRALQGSRRRIVRRAGEARRRLERDLHDGAQQGLLALMLELREARSEAEGAGDAATAAALGEAQHEAVVALDELRRLAHGIYPAVLEDAGLAAALVSLAEVVPLAVELETLPSLRYPPDVEATAYAVAVDAVADAAARSASHIRFAFTESGDRLQLRAVDDGVHRAGPLVRVEDRVGALGGNVSFDPRRISAELPCV